MKTTKHRNKPNFNLDKMGSVLILILMLTGCGGGGGNDESSEKAVTTISGKA